MKSQLSLARRHSNEDDGFTLIELMVVVLIIAILIAIAIPTFLGTRQRAQDRAAQSDLRNGLTAEKVALTATATPAYDASTVNMKAIEPSLGWGGKLTVVVGNSSVGVADMVCLTETSKSGTIFSIADISAGPSIGRYYGKVTCPAATEANFSGLGLSW